MAINGDFMTLTALTRLTKTSKGLIALSLIALVAACGGGGGGGGSDAGVVDKIAIDYPQNNSEVVDVAGEKLRLLYLTNDRDFAKVVVMLNGVNITGYFKQPENADPETSLYALQGIIKEGVNNLTVSMTGSTTAKATFKADLQEPELMVTRVNGVVGSGSLNFSGYIRKTNIETLSYKLSDDTVTEISSNIDGDKVNAAEVRFEGLAPGQNDANPDMSFTVEDDSNSLIDGAGNESIVSLARPERIMQAAMAVQLNNSAFTKVESLADQLMTAVLENELVDIEKPLINVDEAVAFCEPSPMSVIINPADISENPGCEIYVENITISNGSVSSNVNVEDPFNENDDIGLRVASSLEDGAKITINARLDIFKTKAANEPKVTDVSLVLDATNIAATLNLGLQKDAQNNVYLTFDDTPENPVVAIEEPIVEIVSGTCNNTASCKQEDIGTFSGTIEVKLKEILNAEIATFEQDIVKNIVCRAISKDGKTCSSTKVNEIVNDKKIAIAQPETTVKEIKYGENEQQETLGTTVAQSFFSKLKTVSGDGNATKGAFVQLAGGVQMLNIKPVMENGEVQFDANGQPEPASENVNTNFNRILGTRFFPLASETPLNSETPDISKNDNDKVLVALPVNLLNQTLAGLFQSAVIKKQSYEVPLSAIEEIKEDSTLHSPSIFDAAPGANESCIGMMESIKGSDKLVFDQGSIDLKTAPYIRLVKATATEPGYAQLHINGLTAKAQLKSEDLTQNKLQAKHHEFAAKLDLDIVARLNLTLTNEGLPVLSIDESNISLYAAEFKTFIDTAIGLSRNCGLASSTVESSLRAQQITAGDLYEALPAIVNELGDKGEIQLIDDAGNVVDINLQGLGVNEQLDVVLNNGGFGVADSGNYFVLSANICDASDQQDDCYGKKGIFTLRVMDSTAP